MLYRKFRKVDKVNVIVNLAEIEKSANNSFEVSKICLKCGEFTGWL